MAEILSELALIKANQQTKQLQIIFEIDGITELFSTSIIYVLIRIGDPGLLIGDDWVIGGKRPSFNQDSDGDSLISLDGTSTTITQQLDPDKGIGSSVSFLDIALIDKNNTITELITPGNLVDDILGRKCRVYLGFDNTIFTRDYIVLFRGLISEVNSEPGLITFTLSQPEELKRQTLFKKIDTKLNGSITDSDTTITVTSTNNFLAPVTGPAGTIDDDFKSYVQIDNEIIQYDSLTGTTFTVSSGGRGSLGTVAASHTDTASVSSYYVLEGNCMDLALKLMLGGKEGPYEEDIEVTNFVQTGNGSSVSNSIFISEVDLNKIYGVTVGDYITTNSATNSANNVTLKPITSIISQSEGTYFIVDDVTFVLEVGTSALINFRSNYDTFPSGAGLGMPADFVDVISHEQIRDIFLSDVSYKFYLTDEFNGKEFIDNELYRPAGAYTVPAGSRASSKFHAPPIPGSVPITFDDSNIYNFNDLSVKRSLNRNFYNTIVYKYNDEPLDSEFKRNVITVSASSLSRIDVGARSLIIESKGLKSDLGGDSSATLLSQRRLKRYEFASEGFPGVKVFLGDGIQVDVGDTVILDGTSLQISDITNGTRSFSPRLLEVTNKSFNIQSGEITLSLTDTNFDEQARYCLMSPSSKIKKGNSTTQFLIKESYSAKFGASEFQKWLNKIGYSLLVRTADGSISGVCTLLSVNDNILNVTDLGFTPAENYIVELSEYNNQTADAILLYGSMTDEVAFDDGTSPYNML